MKFSESTDALAPCNKQTTRERTSALFIRVTILCASVVDEKHTVEIVDQGSCVFIRKRLSTSH